MGNKKVLIVLIGGLGCLMLGFLIFRKLRARPEPVVEKDPFVFEFDSSKWDKCENRSFIAEEFQINAIPDSSLMLNQHLELTPNLNYSEDSLPVFNYESKAHVFHPGVYIERILSNLHDYSATHDSLYYKRVIRLYDILIKNGVMVDSCLLFPNNYEFKLHGYKNQVMKAPWYSGFTQGVALSAATRLYRLTGNKDYLSHMHQIARSFSLLKPDAKKRNDIWISCIDSLNHIWFEEYPQPYPGLTLNGKVFAILGLYEYVMVTKDPEMKRYLLGGITTIKKNVEKYRMKGDISKYCLKHVANFDMVYHGIHVKQLHTLGLITGDAYFEEMSNNFRKDTIQ